MGTSSSGMSLYKSGSGKSCSYSGLKNGQKYYWKVIVYNGSGKSSQSTTWNFTTKAAPAPTTPSSPSPSSGATNVAVSGTLSWSTAPNDGGSSISYDLYMGTSSSGMSLYKSGSGKSCSYSGLKNGQKYYWKVIVYNGSGKSAQSTTWNFTTKDTPAPTTPSSPSPSSGATNVAVSGTLSWSTAPNDGGSSISYDLYMGTSSSGMSLYKSGSGKSCSYSGLKNGQKYYWKVIVYNGSGKSAQSTTWNFTTKDTPAPTTPSSPSPSDGATNVAVSGTLKWSCSANDGGSTLSYDLYMGTSSSNMTLYKSGSGTSCAYSGLSAGKKYYWKLIAYNGSGKSTQGPVWSFTTKEVAAPSTPSSPSPSNGATNVAVSGTLSWSCSPNDGGSTLSYDLYMGTSSSNMTLYKSGSGTSCAYSGLSAGKKYYWKLIAYNGSGKSTQGPVWSFTTKEVAAPSTPSSPSPSNGATNVAVSGTLSWSCSPNDGGSTLSYDLYMGTSSSNMTLYKSGQGTSCAYSGLANGKTYYWKLIAYNGSGKSTQSPTWSFTTKDAPTVSAPTTPSSPSPSNGAMNVGTSGTLSWSCSPNDGGTTLSYDLYMGTSSSNMTLYKSGQGKSCAYSGLANGKTYYWKLIAYNGSGKSTQSPTWSFTTKDAPTVSAPTTPSSPSPSNGAMNVGTSGTLSWSCSPNDGGTTLSYDLYMGTSSSNMTLYKSGQGKSCAYSGLANGKTYYWKLIAYNGSGKSTQSPTWSFTTTNSSTVSAPTTPSSPSPSNGAMNVGTSGTLKWSCSPNDGGSTLSYDLYIGTSANNMVLYKSGQGTSCSYSLAANTTYYWKLIAYNGSGKSTQSPTWSFTTKAATVNAPTTPSSPSPSSGAMNVGTSGILKWNCSPNDGGTTLSYDLYIGTSANNMTLYKSGQGTSCNYSLASNTTYYWKLIAYNGSGKSTHSPTWSFTTGKSSTSTTLPAPNPSTFNATNITETGFTASWGAVSGAKYYDIKVKSEGGTYEQPVFSQATASTSVNVTGLTPGTSYKFRLRARNGNHNENSDWSGDIPTSVKTKSQGTASANLAIYKIEGFDGSEPLTKGITKQYYVWVINNGSSTWDGTIILKNGTEEIVKWNIRSLSKGVAVPLKYDFTPKSAGNLTLVLYYKTGGEGAELPVNAKGGLGTNRMLVQVNEPAGRPTYNLKIKETISYPTSVRWGSLSTLKATVLNDGNTEWTGSLAFIDNSRVVSPTDIITIPSKGKYTLTAPSWSPTADAVHSIQVSYKTNDELNWNKVQPNGFVNPFNVTVTDINIPTTAQKAKIKFITKDCAPKEVNEGDQVFYYFKITDENGQPLKDAKAQFKCTGSSKRSSVESLPTNEEGLAVLCISTTGTDAIAKRGENATISLTKIVDSNNKSVDILGGNSDGSEFTLNIHRGNGLIDAEVFEDVQSFAVTINRGVSGKADFGTIVGASASLSFPLKTTLSWKDGNFFTEIDSEAKVSGEGHIKVKDYLEGGIGGEAGLKETIKYNWTMPERTMLAILLSWFDASQLFTSTKTMRSIMAIEKWFGVKKGKGFYDPITEETSNTGFLGLEGTLKLPELSWPGDIKYGVMPGTLFPDLQFPTDLETIKVRFKGSCSFKCEPKKYIYDYQKDKAQYGLSRQLKAKFSGTITDLFQTFSPTIGTLAKPIPDNCIRTQTGLYEKTFNHDYGVDANFTISTKEEEMYTTSARTILDKISNSMEIEVGASLSTKQLANYICPEWISEEGESTFSLGASVAWKWKMTSKGPFANYLKNLSYISPNLTKQLFPALNSGNKKYVIEAPYTYYKMWTNMDNLREVLRFAVNGMPSNCNTTDIFMIEHQETDKAEVKLSIPLLKWGLIDVKLDCGLSFDVTFFPSTTYFSQDYSEFLPVTLRSNKTLASMTKDATTFLKRKINNLFGREDKAEIDKEYDNIGKKFENALEPDIKSAFTNRNQQHSNTDNLSRIRKRHPKLLEQQQENICTITCTLNDNEQNFNNGAVASFSHFYPAGCLLGITEENDTLFVLSEVCELMVVEGNDTLKTTQQGNFTLDSTIGIDDLTPFGFSEETPLGVYQSELDSDVWHYVGPAGSTLLTNKLGSYMIATSIKNDVITPEILADYDKTYGVIHLNIKDNIGVRIGSLSITINGEEKEFSMISESSIDVYLTDEEMQHMLTLYVTINDLAGNQGTLFQMYNLDMPTTIEDVKTEEDKTSVQFKDHQLKVEGAKANATICVFSVNGNLVAKAKADEQGRATVQLSSVPDGLYVFTISNGKSGKILVKKVG